METLTTLEQRIRQSIRSIPDFPKPGILFKDITPIFLDPELCKDIINDFVDQIRPMEIDVLCAVESRGFLFGPGIAQKLNIPFVPIRKKGKLPGDTIEFTYELEYGSATVEVHNDAIIAGQRVFIHDDLLATGGTAMAGAELIKMLNGEVAGFGFLVHLGFLNGEERLKGYSSKIISLVDY